MGVSHRSNFLTSKRGERGQSSLLTQLDRLDWNLAMARQLRIQYEGAIYHLMNRGDRREEIFRDHTDLKWLKREISRPTVC
jgi:hypothetical protein